MLGGRRIILLAALAALLLALAVFLRLVVDVNEAEAADLLRGVSLGTLLPLFGLIVGTGAIGPEIDDGSIVYLLSKPVPRSTIIHSKLAVAVTAMLVFAALPTFLAGLIMAGGSGDVAVGFGVGAFAAGAVYSAIFLLLATAMRHAVVLGLVYALIWESLVGSFVPGAQVLSVHQWAVSVTAAITGPGTVDSNVGLGMAIVLLAAAFAAATWYAGQRLRVHTLAGDE
ncbi:ABC transporter permease subunit [Phytoactinopolyspora mesophila]|uniref:ABC transporter permease n=1 Tax=Phytoactinopolyspora mesophila TaxID=2650750 RepID=A0A7K3M544_9ACTN|nr:ABC transporter permease [Phytoactinopolyspora mesophila]NDL58366.1 ABC transporter permease [Phytoactinopolyspora mesophila]